MDRMIDRRIIVALDHCDTAAARQCVEALDGLVHRYKVGSVLFTQGGPSFVRELVESGLGVFLDLKFHDTPATVEGAVRAATGLGVELLTLHASGGSAMIAAARRGRASAVNPPKLLAVTVLTSIDGDAYAEIAGPRARDVDEAVASLASMAVRAGADGCVCSAHETRRLRDLLGPDVLLIVPGIRPEWSASDHSGQTRTATPAGALSAGASAIVIGRAVTAADDPRDAITRIRDEIPEHVLP